MQLVVLGLNHNTAPVDVRERMAVENDALEKLYNNLLADDRVYETVVLSTCNRVEYYFVLDISTCHKQNVLELVSDNCNLDQQELEKYIYCSCGQDAVKHIFSVASGLDSLVLGEPQIFGQIKDAFDDAKTYKGMGTFLNRLAEFTVKAAKRVRTYTGISENPVSVSYAAVELAKKIFDNLNEAKALVIGAGEMCELAARHLVGSGIGKITVTNRTFAKAQTLANEFGGDAIEFDKFAMHLHEADIIISSTGATDYVVSGDMIEKAMEKRKNKPMFFIDIAVPRDIDPAGANVENAYVYDIDDLKSVVEANKKEREKEAKKAQEIVVTYVDNFDDAMKMLNVVPTIKQIRQVFDEKQEEELAKYCEKHKITDPAEIERLKYLLQSTMNKILHTPFTNLKKHASDKSQYTINDAISMIFDTK